MRHFILIIAGLATGAWLSAQTPVSNAVTTPANTARDTSAGTLKAALRQGSFRGSFRTFFMATDNTSKLSDYYALAAGGGLHYSSGSWHGFSFGVGGVFHFNLSSSDLSAVDSITGAKNRYEIGLFDVEDPHNRNNLDRMDEFWLRYARKNTRVTVGKQSLQTPFINAQDGRMRPTAETAIWVENNAWKNTKLEGGWLWKISPRSTVRWYDVGASIGLYPKGLNPDGTGSGYPANLHSQGIAIAGISRHWGTRTRVQVWDQWVENIFNTAFVQADHTYPLKNGHKLLVGLQWIHQNALGDGGNPDASKTYFQKGGISNAFSVQTGWQKGGWQSILAYTHITDEGRFLTPREWGREPFFTFLSRERIEGSGNTHAMTGRVNWQSRQKKWRVEGALGVVMLPDVKNAPLNKYAFPSYDQFNLDVRYKFSGPLDGLTTQLLVVRKGLLGNVYGNKKYVINKVDVTLYNLVLNYTY